MKKFFVTGMLGLAACTGLSGIAVSGSLFDTRGGFGTKQAPLVRIQVNEAYRVQQLEEQIRQLNGCIEEMSFQLLQMQETIRKVQEDNEFRFQELESGNIGGKGTSPTIPKKKKAETNPVSLAMPLTDDVAMIIKTPPSGGASILPFAPFNILTGSFGRKNV